MIKKPGPSFVCFNGETRKKKWCLSNMISKCLPNDFLHIIYLFESNFEKWDDGVKKNMTLEKSWMWGWMSIVAAFGRCQSTSGMS